MTPLRIQNISTPLILKIIFGLLLLAITIWYVSFQARLLIAGPQLTLLSPNEVVHYEQTITLVGNAENITAITLNGRAIHTDEEGQFEERLVLENGYTIMTLSAEDRFGRMTSVVREYVYDPTLSIN